jgi:hypothetical protein
MMDDHRAHILAARTAVRQSAAVRRALRGKTPPDRDERLRASLASLTAAGEPLTAVLRSGPMTGRSLRHPDVRAASEAVQAERAKVRGMLRRASGGRKRVEPYSRASFRGYVGYVGREVTNIETDLRHGLPQLSPGSPDYRKQAQKALAKIDHLQRELTRNRRRADHWSLVTWGKLRRADRTLFETAEELARGLTAARKRAKKAVAVPIRLGVAQPQRPKQPAAKRRRWSENDAWAALVAFTAAEGRTPTSRDLPGNPDLPSWHSVYRLFGGMPDADDLLYDARNS